MKIREYLANVDIEKCGFGSYWICDVPCCPIAHAAHARGAYSAADDTASVGIHPAVRSAYTGTWDRLAALKKIPRSVAHEKALEAAESTEAALDRRRTN